MRKLADLSIRIDARNPRVAESEPRVEHHFATANNPATGADPVSDPVSYALCFPLRFSVSVPAPVNGSDPNFELGIRMAPGPNGGLYVSMPMGAGVAHSDVVALLDKTGKPSQGWPVMLPDVYGCDSLLAADDSSLRVVCSAPSTNLEMRRVFALDANGRSLAGWPVDIGNGYSGRMIGAALVTFETTIHSEDAPGQDLIRLLVIQGDGTVQRGVDLPTCGAHISSARTAPAGVPRNGIGTRRSRPMSRRSASMGRGRVGR